MRNLFLLLAASMALAGCSTSTTFKNPVDGTTSTCTGGLAADVNLWSGYQICVEEYVAAGYQPVP
jgi:uncharacterized protein YceK